MNAKAMFIGESWTTRTVVYGKKRYVFHGGEALHIPVAVAVVLRNQKNEKGKPVFKITDLPVLIKAVHPPVKNITEETMSTCVVSSPRQRKLAECRL